MPLPCQRLRRPTAHPPIHREPPTDDVFYTHLSSFAIAPKVLESDALWVELIGLNQVNVMRKTH